MASGQGDSSNKTEKPTPKRLRDARKEGNVSKSKELTSTVVLLGWLILLGYWLPHASARMGGLFEVVLGAVGKPFPEQIGRVAAASIDTLLALLMLPLLLIFCLTVAIEFLQAGPVLSTKKITPDINRMNPAEGVKRMFSQENVVELAKAVLKTVVLLGLCSTVLLSQLDEILRLIWSTPPAIGSMWWHTTAQLTGWVVFLFLFVSVVDAFYQRFAYMKRLRMSRQEVIREHKEQEGDPYVKARRRQLHTEWAQRNTVQAARNASVLVTNPTHIAIALLYEPGETVVPLITGKGEGDLAKQMREAAEEAGVPIMQNVPLARGLNEKAEIDEYVPVEFFEAVAEVLRWAANIRAQQAAAKADPNDEA